jgi:Anti-sigma factor NepR
MGGGSMKKPNPVEKSTLNNAALDPKVLETIGRALKAHYDDLVHAPLPDKLLDLLARLEKEEQREKPEEKPDASG